MFRSGPPCFEMVAEPSDPKGQGPLVRVPRLQVMVLTFMALLALVAADGGGNDELGALGMAESFVNMPEEPEAEERHMVGCRKFEAYDLGDAGRHGEGQQGVQQTIWTGMHTWTSTTNGWMNVITWKSTTSPWTSLGSERDSSERDMAWACVRRSWSEMVHQTGKWYSLDNGEAWNLVNEKEPNDNDKHGNLNHFFEMNEMNRYDMMDYEQHLVINEFKIFDGAWFLVNINDKLGFAHCLDYIDFKIFEHHYMNNYVDTVFNGWQCLVKYVFKVSIFILRFFLYMVDKVMAMWYSGLVQLAAMCLRSFSWTRSTSIAMASMALSWMASMPMALAQELRGKELQFGLMAVILVCITWFPALMNRNWMSSQWMKTCQTSRVTRLEKRCAGRKRCNERRKLMAVIFLCSI